MKRRLTSGQPRPPLALQRRDRGGFTIVELLVVITVMGIIATIALPSLRLGAHRTDAASLELLGRLGVAQRTAVLRGHDIVLSFDSAESRIRVHYDLNNDGVVTSDEDVHFVALVDGVSFGRTGAPARSLGPDWVTFDGEQDSAPAVTFHRSGSASEAGVIYLTPSGGGQADEDRALEIDRGTGRARCYRYDDSSWKEKC